MIDYNLIFEKKNFKIIELHGNLSKLRTITK